MRITGDIVSNDDAWFYEWFSMDCTSPGSIRSQLSELNGAPLTVWIDSYGGDTVAASAIYTALMEYPGPVTAKVDGAAYSAASLIAMAAETVLMSPTATMMVHLPWTYAAGNEHDMRRTADVLEEVGETLMNAYEIKTGKPRAEIRALLKAETWMGAKKAIDLGFADGMLYGWDSETAQDAVVAQARVIFAYKRPEPRRDTWTDRAAAMLALEQLRT